MDLRSALEDFGRSEDALWDGITGSQAEIEHYSGYAAVNWLK
jgi:hypothetical protein